jgi:hypothetical protein
MDAAWLIGAYLLGSFAFHFLNLVDFSILKAKNEELEKENIEIKKVVAELAKSIENQARLLSIRALTSIVGELQKMEAKEIK